jgi:hypothetical protein
MTEPQVPLGEARKEDTNKSVTAGAKPHNAPLHAAGIGILRICHLLMLREIIKLSFNFDTGIILGLKLVQ